MTWTDVPGLAGSCRDIRRRRDVRPAGSGFPFRVRSVEPIFLGEEENGFPMPVSPTPPSSPDSWHWPIQASDNADFSKVDEL